jgi:3-dehydroquinate synthase
LRRIILETPGSVSAILVGARWEAVTRLLPDSGVVIISDQNVNRIYGDRFPRFPVLKIKPGEESKTLSVIEKLSSDMLRLGIDRSGFILGIGGGVVCDVAGFLASVYLRGIRCAYISTSLLAQVDASTGGKTGVNLGIVKNVIGTIRQPEFVICDTTMLRTLPEKEYMSGLAELIKTGLIGDRAIIGTLEDNLAGVIRRERNLLTDLVFKSVKVKAGVVARDEKESGPRRVLNFGHTFGHAIELYEGISHGFAVAAGMELAARYSFRKGYLGKKNYLRISTLLKSFGYPLDIRIPAGKMRELILHDKKKAGDEIFFVFLKGIGKPFVEKVPVNELIDFYRSNKDK